MSVIKFNFILFTSLFIPFFSISQNSPLDIYWTGRTKDAIKLSNEIIKGKEVHSRNELSNAYDCLAEINLEQGHLENNRRYLHLQFQASSNTPLDSALFYARLTNYYHCFVMVDSSEYFAKKAISAFGHATNKRKDSLTISRYYSYLGNGGRNISIRNIAWIDSALLFTNRPFLKALHYRRYATFLTDLFASRPEEKWNNKQKLKYYTDCITSLSMAQKIVDKIYPDKKSSINAQIFSIWALAEKYRGNEANCEKLYEKAKQSLIAGEKIINDHEYCVNLSWEAWNKIDQYKKTKQIKWLYEAETALQKAIPVWEKFYEEETGKSKNGFDDQYSFNPYQQLVSLNYELFSLTDKYYYLVKCYGLSELLKNRRPGHNATEFLLDSVNQSMLKNITKHSKQKNCAVLNYIFTVHPYYVLSIVTLPDTTLFIKCSQGVSMTNYLAFNYYKKQLLANEITEFKNNYYKLYKAYFKSIEKELEKRKITHVVILPDGTMSDMNFDLLQSDSLPSHSVGQSALLHKYKFSYNISGNALVKSGEFKKHYAQVECLTPEYSSAAYPKLLSGKKLVEEIKSSFNVCEIIENTKKIFFEQHKLLHFMGHAEAGETSLKQNLIMSDTEKLNSNEILTHNLEGSTYILNGCGSNLGRTELYSKTNSFPFNLMNQNAHAVISANWQLDDKENATFFIVFYDYLEKGYTSSEALYQTKLYFARNNNSPAMWSAYRYFGGDFTLEKNKPDFVIYFLIIASVLLIVLASYKLLFRNKQA